MLAHSPPTPLSQVTQHPSLTWSPVDLTIVQKLSPSGGQQSYSMGTLTFILIFFQSPYQRCSSSNKIFLFFSLRLKKDHLLGTKYYKEHSEEL